MIEARKMEDDKGFSMVELLIFLGMAVVMMAVAIPMLSSSMRSMQLMADARSIATSLTLAKMSSTAQMTHCRLSFDLGGGEWRLEKLNKSTGEFELQQADNELSSGVANSGIVFKSSSSSAPSGFPTDSSAAITFNSRGIPIDGAGIPTTNSVVYLSMRDTDFAVTVSLGGKVQLWKYENDQWVAQ